MNRPFDSLLDSSYIPQQEEFRSIKALIDKQSADLASLEDEIWPIADLYYSMVARRQTLKDSLDVHRGLVSMTRCNKIPDDVLREIFMHCLPVHGGACMHPDEAPILLARISSNWRRVALSTPRLWASFQVHLVDDLDGSSLDSQPPEDTIERQTITKREVLRTWLDRSKACPLAITAFGQHSTSGTGRDLFELIISASKRWEKINFSLSEDCFHRLSRLGPDDLNSLTSMDLHIEQPDPWDIIHGTHSLDRASLFNTPLFSTPGIRHFGFRSFATRTERPPVNWGNLVTLNILSKNYPKTISEIVDLLKNCRRIVTFIVFIDSYPEPNDPVLIGGEDMANRRSAEVFTLPYLTSLELSAGAPAQTSAEFRELRMPAIRRLKYTSPPEAHPHIRSPILSLTQAYTLQSLSISSLSLRPEQLIECLRSCGELNALSIIQSLYSPLHSSDATTFNDFLKTLSTPDEEGGFICPKLEVLQHTGLASGSLSWSDEDILCFIKWKQAGTQGLAKLKRLFVYLGRCQEKPLRDDLKPFRDDGLKIILRYIPKSPSWRAPLVRYVGDTGSTFSTHGFDILDAITSTEVF